MSQGRGLEAEDILSSELMSWKDRDVLHKAKARNKRGKSSRFKNANLQFEDKRKIPKRNGKHIAN